MSKCPKQWWFAENIIEVNWGFSSVMMTQEAFEASRFWVNSCQFHSIPFNSQLVFDRQCPIIRVENMMPQSSMVSKTIFPDLVRIQYINII